MKHKLLLMVAVGLTASIFTTSRAGSWTVPNIASKAQTIVSGNVYYIYNTGAGQFLTEGNYWGTCASIGATGLQFKPAFIGTSATNEQIYALQDSSVAKKAWKYLFMAGVDGAYVDMGNQGHQYWSLKEVKTGIYTIQVPDSDTMYGPAVNNDGKILYGTTYFGYKNDGTTIVHPMCSKDSTGADKYCLEWAFIPKADYPVAAAQLALYAKLNDAEKAGVSTDAALAVYNNASSTADELNAAVTALNDAIKNSAITNASATNPADMTVSITNPDFATDNTTGWSYTGTKGGGNIGAYGSTCTESWNSTSFNFGQTLKNLPNGVYKLSANAFYRHGGYVAAADARAAGTETINAFLYANNDSTALMSLLDGAGKSGTTGVSTTYGYVPNSMAEARTYFNANAYSNNELLFVLTADTMRIGVKKSVHLGDDWTIFSNFKLTYYGNKSDAYKLLLQNAVDKATPYVDSESKMGTDVKDALTATLDNAKKLLASDNVSADDVTASKNELTKDIANIEASIAAYASLKTAMDNATTIQNTIGSDALTDFYVEKSIDEGYENASFTTDEATSYTAQINTMIDEAKKNAVQVGDATSLLTNPGFQPDATGWTITGVVGTGNSEVEFFNQVFDMSQTLTGIPNGKYTVKCQGFLRAGSNDAAWAGYQNGTNKLNAKLYANSNETSLEDVMAEHSAVQYHSGNDYTINLDGSTVYTPNSMTGARGYFDNNYYDKNAVSAVVTDHKLTLGVRMTEKPGDACWVLVDNFRLSFEGSSADVLKDELTSLKQTATDLASKAMSADSLKALNAAITEANNATDDAMTPIAHLNVAIPAAKSSAATYEKLATALKVVEDTINVATASDALTTLSAAYAAISDKYMSGAYADADIPAAIIEVRKALGAYMAAKLNMAAATDAAPVDATALITNPDFSDAGNGWTGAGSTTFSGTDYSEMEQYNTTFDTYQILYGLPNGTYKVSVQGYYRDGGYTSAASLHNAGTEALNAMLYANDRSKGLMSIFDGGSKDSLEIADIVKVNVAKDGKDSCYIPNMMSSARIFFDNGAYTDNSLFVDVTDGVLRLGAKKTVAVDTDWTIFDNFKLTYYGTNSTNGINNASQSTTVLKRSIYTVNGMATSKLTRGINIIKSQMSDGTVRITKVLVK
jgi:hypothetical protein